MTVSVLNPFSPQPPAPLHRLRCRFLRTASLSLCCLVALDHSLVADLALARVLEQAFIIEAVVVPMSKASGGIGEEQDRRGSTRRAIASLLTSAKQGVHLSARESLAWSQGNGEA